MELVSKNDIPTEIVPRFRDLSLLKHMSDHFLKEHYLRKHRLQTIIRDGSLPVILY